MMTNQPPSNAAPASPEHTHRQGPTEPESAISPAVAMSTGAMNSAPPLGEAEKALNPELTNLENPCVLRSIERQRELIAVGMEGFMHRMVVAQELCEPEVYKAFLALATIQKTLAQTSAQIQRGRPVSTGAVAQRLLNSAFGAGHGGRREGSGRKPIQEEATATIKEN